MYKTEAHIYDSVLMSLPNYELMQDIITGSITSTKATVMSRTSLGSEITNMIRK